MRDEKRVIVIWPQYLDSTIPRRLGRRLPKNYSISKPTLDELVTACKELGLECKADESVRYSRTWYLGGNGRVVIYGSRDTKKLNLLKALSAKVKDLRTLGKRS